MPDTNFANDYYANIIPQLLEWAELEYTQEEMASELNRAGRVNSCGRPYSQDTISRLLKRTRERLQVA